MARLLPGEIAERDARRLAVVLREIGGDSEAVGSGSMACDRPGSWADYAAGLGNDGPVDDATLDAFVAFYRSRGRTPRIQVTPYQDPSLLLGLGHRGFTTYEFETVLAHTLEVLPEPRPVAGLQFRRVDPTSDADVAAFQASQIQGFEIDEERAVGMRPITDRVARAPRSILWLLELDGRVVGSGGLEVFENTAVMIAGCIHAEARRRGLQTAFIHHRLRHAVASGWTLVTIGSLAGAATERNALRAGFQPAYTQVGLHQL